MSKGIDLQSGQEIEVVHPLWRAPARVHEVTRDRIVTGRPDGLTESALEPGGLVTLRFVVKEPPHEGEYLSETRFVGVTTGLGTEWVFEYPALWIRNQKRAFARVDVDLSTRCRVGASRWLPTSVVNLSAGGFAFLWESEVEPGMPVSAVIALPAKPIKVHGIAVRSYKFQDGKKNGGKFAIGVRITRIDERDRDRVVQFVFQKQVEMRRRGRV